ncbi:MAG: amidohydrolase family protein [Bacteroidota bacterium]
MRFTFPGIIVLLFFTCCNTGQDNSRYILLRDANIISFTGSTDAPFKASILIKDSVIYAIAGTGDKLDIPRNTQVIDCSGQYIMPGLWDTHVHLFKTTRQALPAYLQYGITSVRDMGGDMDTLNAIVRDIKNQKIGGPRIHYCGAPFENAWFLDWYRKNRIEEPQVEDITRTRIALLKAEDAQRLVDSVLSSGAEFIKVRDYKDSTTYWALARAARKRGVKLAGHPPYGLDPIAIADSGQSTFEHGWFPSLKGLSQSRKDSVIRKYKEKNCLLVPTIIAWKYNQFSSYGFMDSAVNGPKGIRDPRIETLPPMLLAEWKAQLMERKKNNNLRAWKQDALQDMYQETIEMYRSGIQVMPGTDDACAMVFPGESLHDELALFVQCLKMSPYEALASAIVVPAKYMGVDHKTGSIEKGKLADLIILKKNPLDDIRNSKTVGMTIINGRILYSKN